MKTSHLAWLTKIGTTTPTRIKDYERLAAGSVGSVPDPAGPVRLDQWGAFNLDGCGPRPSSQGDRGKELRKRFWTQSHHPGPRENYRQLPTSGSNGECPRH